jgi:hypothetical protein
MEKRYPAFSIIITCFFWGSWVIGILGSCLGLYAGYNGDWTEGWPVFVGSIVVWFSLLLNSYILRLFVDMEANQREMIDLLKKEKVKE